MNLPKTELTNDKIDEILKYLVDNAEMIRHRIARGMLDPAIGFEYNERLKEEAKEKLATLIHQAEIKARLDELVKLKKAHSIAIFDEYLENHIEALEKEIV